MTATTVSNGRSTHTMCRRDESNAAWRQASCTSPPNRPATPSWVTTTARSDSGVFKNEAARLITALTGVAIVPITS